MPTIWQLPNFSGELFTADATTTPLLTMLGGLTNGGRITDNFQFPTSSEYAFPAAAQPNITENASLNAPAGTQIARGQATNVCQIHHEAITLSYNKVSNGGRMTGVNTAGQENSVISEKDWQIEQKLIKIARDAEFSFINGVFQLAVDADTANRTRGLLPLIAGAGGASNLVDAQGAALSLPLIQTALRTMAGNGAFFRNVVIHVNAFQKQQISNILGFAPADRNVGGVNIQQVETDFGVFGVVYNRFVPANTVLFAEMEGLAPVFQEVPDKGILFYEELAKIGASERGQLYGAVGLAHGPAWMHGSITDLAIA